MADHVWGIGGGAEMMIRDHGVGNGHVEFWFHAGAQTWNNQQDWGYDAGWGYQGGVFKLNSGGGWHHLGTVHIPSSRNVMMRMVGEGLGWGTSDRTVWIPRATVPAINHSPHSTVYSDTSAYVGTHLGGDGGSGYTAHQMWGSNTPHGPAWHWLNWHYGTVNGLARGTTYWFWSRSANALGWSGWSHVGAFTTHNVPAAPNPVYFHSVRQNGVHAQFAGNGGGGMSILEWQIGYGRDPNYPTHFVSHYVLDVNNLDPGQTYYFWARGRNGLGWGPWSSVRAQTLRAGAYVKDAGVWKRALPYEKVNGIWRLAKPYVKHAGVWKETS